MITYSCDKCGADVCKAADDATGIIQKRGHGFPVNSGYVGEKYLCRDCFNLWTAHVRLFFGV